ncbi:MAG: hypothetical protein Q4E46_03325 [Candidatus Saccharibacteria bacterium]|nr:hypothetical protein [Candidatus Saccharibacteria bacterium]
MAEKEKKPTKASTETKTKTKSEPKTEKPKAETSKTDSSKSNNGLIIGIASILAAAVIAFLCWLCFNKPLAADDPKASPTYSPAFFISDNSKYTIWNAEGKRVIEDEYDAHSDFVGGYAYVKKGNEYALINDSGKYSVEFGQISQLISYGGGIYHIKKNDGTEHILTGSGKDVLTGENMKLSYSSISTPVVTVTSGDSVYIYNYDGKELAKLEKKDDAKVEFSASKDFNLVSYNGWNYLFDARSSKQLTAFEGDRYRINSVSENRNKVLMREDENSTPHRLYADGKFYELNEKKSYAMTSDQVYGYDDYDAVALLNEDYKVALTVKPEVAVKDLNNYAVRNDDGGIDIFYKGEKVKTFSDDPYIVSGFLTYEDHYLIENDEKFAFYTLDGKNAFDKEFGDARLNFDKHHLAMVSDVDNDEAFYFINGQGKKIGEDTFSRVYSYDKSYELKNADGKYAIADVNGKVLTGFDYKDGTRRSNAVDHEIWTLDKDDKKVDVFDVTNNKMLAQGVETNTFSANYFSVKNAEDSSRTDYYTYDGVIFYTSQKKES